MAECAVILYDKDKRILIQHRTDDAPKDPDRWGFFGGCLEKGETPLDAAKRECSEELEYSLENPLLILKINQDNTEAYVFIEKYNPKKKLVLKEGKDMKWFKIKDIDKINMVPHCKEILEKIEKTLDKHFR